MTSPLGRVIGTLRPPGDWTRCPGCGEDYTSMPDDLCASCTAQRAKAEAMTREAILERAECPARYIRPELHEGEPWQEPDPWPKTSRGADLGAWSGVPCLVTLAGPTGTGKSMLATGLLCRLALAGGVRWIRAARIPDLTVGAKTREERAESWARLTAVRGLVVDDLGRGHEGGAWPYVTDVVVTRYEAGLPTILTTNLDGSKIITAAPDLYDRMRDGWRVVLSGKSRRGR